MDEIKKQIKKNLIRNYQRKIEQEIKLCISAVEVITMLESYDVNIIIRHMINKNTKHYIKEETDLAIKALDLAAEWQIKKYNEVISAIMTTATKDDMDISYVAKGIKLAKEMHEKEENARLKVEG